VKRAFDPDAILNPGAKLASAGEHAIEQVKYDPELPPLAGDARRVLATVERDRAYARSRLELLADAHAASGGTPGSHATSDAPLD